MVARVRAHEPDLVQRRGRRPAATALILHEHDATGLQALFVRRTTRASDRWSGQMALPGGRQEDGDHDLATTAARETAEEVGIELGEPAGRLDDLGTATSGVVVATFVFVVTDVPELVLQAEEIADAVWVPLAHLDAPEAATTHRYRGMGPFPAIRYADYVIWGLTYRIVTRFLRIVR